MEKTALFCLLCFARLLSCGRLVLLRNVYLHAVGNTRALAHYTAAGNKRRQAIHAVRQYTRLGALHCRRQ